MDNLLRQRIWNKVVLISLRVLIWGFIGFAIYVLIITWTSKKCKISDGTHIGNIDNYPPLKFVLSDYIVVKVKDAEITEIFYDSANVEKHAYKLDADSSVIVKDSNGQQYKIHIVR